MYDHQWSELAKYFFEYLLVFLAICCLRIVVLLIYPCRLLEAQSKYHIAAIYSWWTLHAVNATRFHIKWFPCRTKCYYIVSVLSSSIIKLPLIEHSYILLCWCNLRIHNILHLHKYSKLLLVIHSTCDWGHYW